MRNKNKTLATWLTFLGGPLGLHRFYLKGFGDLLGWLLPIPTALGLYGVEDGQRLTALGMNGQPFAENALSVGPLPLSRPLSP